VTTTEIWAGYAKDRFESTAKRVDEFRNWARQLGAAIAVAIGFELTLLGRALDIEAPNEWLRYACLAVFLVAAIVQAWLLFRMLRTGYVGRKALAPESPVTLWRYLEQKSPDETGWIIGAYYANAHDQFHALSEELDNAVGRATDWFARSIVLLLLGVALFVLAAV
jgi:hypothetical protein